MGGRHDQRNPPAGGQEHGQSITPPCVPGTGGSALTPVPSVHLALSSKVIRGYWTGTVAPGPGAMSSRKSEDNFRLLIAPGPPSRDRGRAGTPPADKPDAEAGSGSSAGGLLKLQSIRTPRGGGQFILGSGHSGWGLSRSFWWLSRSFNIFVKAHFFR